MPFTLSHAAAILPAVRTDGGGRGPLVPAVLVAGSFAPDMTYYAASAVPGAMEFGDVTHAARGVFTVDVVIAWVLVGLWLLVREPLVALLPRARQGRVAALTRCGAPRARVRPSLVARWYVSAVLGSRRTWSGTRSPITTGGDAARPGAGRGDRWVAGVLVRAVREFGGGRGGGRAVRGAGGAPRGPRGHGALGVPVLSAGDRWGRSH